jgi:hypothetical protein
MNRIRCTALALATTLLLALAASATPREEGAGEPAAAFKQMEDWFAGVWRAVTGADSTEAERGADIDPNGLAAPPIGSGGSAGESEAGVQGECDGDCGPAIDPNG